MEKGETGAEEGSFAVIDLDHFKSIHIKNERQTKALLMIFLHEERTIQQ